MKTLTRIMLGMSGIAFKPGGRKKIGRVHSRPKKPRKNLLLILLERLAGIPVSALEYKWNDDLWNPDF